MRKHYCILLVMLVILIGCNDNNTTNKIDDTEQEVVQTYETIEFETELTNGHYVIGEDLPAGNYDITSISGNGIVYVNETGDREFYAMMGVSGNESEIYEVEYKDVEFYEGSILSISGVTISLISEEASSKPLITRTADEENKILLGEGIHVVGKDLKEGIYNIRAVSGQGSVISNNMFEHGIFAYMGVEKTLDDDFTYEQIYYNISLTDDTNLNIVGVDVELIPVN